MGATETVEDDNMLKLDIYRRELKIIFVNVDR